MLELIRTPPEYLFVSLLKLRGCRGYDIQPFEKYAFVRSQLWRRATLPGFRGTVFPVHKHSTVVTNTISFIHGFEKALSDRNISGCHCLDFLFGQREAGQEERNDRAASLDLTSILFGSHESDFISAEITDLSCLKLSALSNSDLLASPVIRNCSSAASQLRRIDTTCFCRSDNFCKGKRCIRGDNSHRVQLTTHLVDIPQSLEKLSASIRQF